MPQRAASEETRRQILETALALFRERGFEETTIRDIAGRAGLSLGAAYYYFKSKEAIVGAYYDYVQQEHQARAREAFAQRRRASATVCGRRSTPRSTSCEADRRLLRALFRYGGDPDHALSWFGPATREQRQLSIDVFAEALRASGCPTMCGMRRRHCCGRCTWASCSTSCTTTPPASVAPES